MQPPPAWSSALLASVSHNLSSYCGQSMSLVLVSLARLGITPDQVLLDACVCVCVHLVCTCVLLCGPVCTKEKAVMSTRNA